MDLAHEPLPFDHHIWKESLLVGCLNISKVLQAKEAAIWIDRSILTTKFFRLCYRRISSRDDMVQFGAYEGNGLIRWNTTYLYVGGFPTKK